jgi:hypothetical protein
VRPSVPGLRHPTISDGAGFLQRLVNALLVYCLETARRDANTDKFLQLRHPNTLTLQIGRESARHHFRDVPAYTAFLLGQTAPVNHAASHRSGSCDVTNFHLEKKPRNLPCPSVEVKRIITLRSLRSGLAVALYVERAIADSGQT